MAIKDYFTLEGLKRKFTSFLEEYAFGEKISHKITGGMTDRVNELLNLNHISDWLPYQCYDPDLEIYHMNEASGFLLQMDPMAGANLEDDRVFYDLLQVSLPEGAIVHGKLLASTRIGDLISKFENSRSGKSKVLETMARSRAHFLKTGALQSLLKSQEYSLRDFKLYFSIIFPKRLEINEKTIADYKLNFIQELKGIGLNPSIVQPDELLVLLSELLCPEDNIFKPKTKSWNPLEPLNYQVGDPPMRHLVTPTHIQYGDQDWSIQSYYVEKFPKQPIFLPEVRDFIGDIFDSKAKLSGAFSIGFTVEIIPQSWVTKTVGLRADLARRRAQEQGKSSDKSIKESLSWRGIIEMVENQERAVDGVMTITVYCKSSQRDKIQSQLNKIFRKPGKNIQIKPNYFLEWPLFLADLPLVQTSQLFNTLRKVKRTQRMWVQNAANLFPVISEVKGHPAHQFILGQRLGQCLFWDPFQSNTNFNVCIAGDSGAGKSVMVNELINSIIATDGSVCVVDLGHSYRKQCVTLNGSYIPFKGSPFSINPFSHVDFDNPEEQENFVEFMESLVMSMADPESNTLTEYHNSVISQAITYTIQEKKNLGCLQDIIDFLLKHVDPRVKDIATMLARFSEFDITTNRPGLYSKLFDGPAEIDLNSKFIVFELEGVSNRLKPAILKILMYLVTIKMYLGNRRNKIALIIDEAYDTFKGEAGVSIAEGVARRARKYGGCLVAATQSISDFFTKPAALAIYKQSHWTLMMKQKSSNIEQAVSNGEVDFDENQIKLMHSVKTVKGDFSEVLIFGGDGEVSLGRLILDPYSIAMYSTQSADHEILENDLKAGLPMEHAIWNLAQTRYGLKVEYGKI